MQKLFILRIAKKVVISIAGICFTFAALLFGAKLLLEVEITSVKEQQKSSIIKVDENQDVTIEDAIRELNATTSRLDGIQQDYVFWTTVLTHASAFLPDTVDFSSIDIDQSASTFTVKGTAPTREAYTQLRESLTGTPYLTDVIVPISLQKENIQFSVSSKTSASLYEE